MHSSQWIRFGFDLNTFQFLTNRNLPVGHANVVEYLIESGAALTIANKDGWLPLHLATKNGHENVTILLIENGTDVNIASESRSKQTPIHAASKNGKENVVKTLLEKGANVNYKDSDGNSALHLGAENGDFQNELRIKKFFCKIIVFRIIDFLKMKIISDQKGFGFYRFSTFHFTN